MARAAKATASRKKNNRVNDNVVFENVRIIFRNFKGEEKPYNRAGHREFCVVIDEEGFAKKLSSDGWNVKVLPPRDDDEESVFYIPVTVSYGPYPPKIFLLTRNNKVKLDEDTVGELDDADIENVDLIMRPYNWDINGKTGVKAYLKSMYVKIREDILSEKYASYGNSGFDDEEDDEDDLPF